MTRVIENFKPTKEQKLHAQMRTFVSERIREGVKVIPSQFLELLVQTRTAAENL
ncbi:MAG: hypothetical protein V4449_00150 [Patescibacteria group bacterium]